MGAKKFTNLIKTPNVQGKFLLAINFNVAVIDYVFFDEI